MKPPSYKIASCGILYIEVEEGPTTAEEKATEREAENRSAPHGREIQSAN